MTPTIDLNRFVDDSLERIFKQVHLADKFDLMVCYPKDIPTKSKFRKEAKGVVPGDFFNGSKSKIIVLKAKDPSKIEDADSVKISEFVRTTFFLSKDSEYSNNDVYKVQSSEEEKNKSNSIWFTTKIEII